MIAAAVEKHPKQQKLVSVNWPGFYGKQKPDVVLLPESRSLTLLICATLIGVDWHIYVYSFK